MNFFYYTIITYNYNIKNIKKSIAKIINKIHIKKLTYIFILIKGYCKTFFLYILF